jgi:hypothetical protein
MLVGKLTYILGAGFFLSVIIAQLSGNDKSPYLVIFFIFLNLIMFGINLVLCLKNPLEKKFRINVVYSLCLMLYVGATIYLSRMGVIDSTIFLGFR